MYITNTVIIILKILLIPVDKNSGEYIVSYYVHIPADSGR